MNNNYNAHSSTTNNNNKHSNHFHHVTSSTHHHHHDDNGLSAKTLARRSLIRRAMIAHIQSPRYRSARMAWFDFFGAQGNHISYDLFARAVRSLAVAADARDDDLDVLKLEVMGDDDGCGEKAAAIAGATRRNAARIRDGNDDDDDDACSEEDAEEDEDLLSWAMFARFYQKTKSFEDEK